MYLYNILRTIISLIFIISSFLKIINFNIFYFTIFYVFRNKYISGTLALFIILIEFISSIFILMNKDVIIFTSILIVILIVFSLFLFYLIITKSEQPCNCFGSLSFVKVTYFENVRNVLIFSIGIFIIRIIKNYEVKC